MHRAFLVLLFLAPAALAERAWVGDIPGCTREAAFDGKPLPYGCATALNLAAMVNDPADLVSPSASNASRAGVLMHAVTGARNGERETPVFGGAPYRAATTSLSAGE